ncbi:uracil-DNA glycosylase [Kaistia sp. 32K]|uniref:uracil-DNA glycosylase n=1 Tax=Kaistia sp. 32K TaxID=2795690 RepID=UPI0019168B41|nr:uracil-DNA glycosylase [Kaistia sp. 32K]BCP54284.1 uracil-DNA glycosylase [Kaistia sp. 32K]
MAREFHPPSPEALAALLDWYVANEVDVAIEEEAVNRLVPRAAEEPPQPVGRDLPLPVAEPAPRPQPMIATAASPEADAFAAREAAMSANSLAELDDILGRFEGCALKMTAKSLVTAEGNPNARVMLIGDPPGRDEDLQGEVFAGPAGTLLDRMLAAIGLARGDVYVAPIVPWRPPGNRALTPQEAAVCRPFIERRIALVDPDFLVFLGATAAKELLQTSEGILRLRGQWRTYDTGNRQIQAMATLHPSHLLLQPIQKRLVWRDLLSLKVALGGGI